MPHAIRPMKNHTQSKFMLPGSKSMTCRALLLAALADGVSELTNIHIDDDIRTLVHALSQLGIVTQFDEKTASCIIAGGNGQFPKKQATVWCGNTRLITRLLLAACATTPGVFYFDGSATLRSKRFTALLHLLSRQGVQFIPNDTDQLPFSVVGSDSLQGGEITLDESINSQAFSALLMISPLARSPFNFNAKDLNDHPSIAMTCWLMAEYGVLVHRIHQNQFMVPVPQRYQAKDIAIEPDFAIAAFFFAAAAITNSEITIQSAKATLSKQPDAKLLTILQSIGCRLHETHTGLSVTGSNELQGAEINLRHFTSTFLALAAIAPFAKTSTHITHTGSLCKKERVRMQAIKTEFLNMGIRVETGDNWITIFPGRPKSIAVNAQNDPHLAMAFSVVSIRTPGMIIKNAECINQLYPHFSTQWKKLYEQCDINA